MRDVGVLHSRRGAIMSRVVLCGFVVWLAAPAVARADDFDDLEDKAVARVEKLGGRVTRDEKRPGRPVVAVNLDELNGTDAALKELAAFPHLRKLSLRETDVTDTGLKELSPLKNLTTLDLFGSR